MTAPPNYAYRPSPQQRPKPLPPGARFGLVVVVRDAPGIHGARVLVRCDCGNERVVHGTNLRSKPPTTHRGCK
jgi:hypothetical protein